MKRSLNNVDMENSTFSIFLTNGDVYYINTWHNYLDGEKSYTWSHYDELGISLGLVDSSRKFFRVIVPWSSVLKIVI